MPGMYKLRRYASVAAAGFIAALASAPAAAACGGDTSGPVFEHGRSAGGQLWSQIACAVGQQALEVDLLLPEPHGGDAGGGFGAPMPPAPNPLYVDAPRVDLGSDNEGEVDGVAFSAVTRLQISFRSGPPLIAATRRAPAGQRRRYAYLRPLRFFVIFYSGHRGIPKTVCVLNAGGRQSHCQRVLGS